MLGNEVVLDVDEFTLSVDPLEGVATVAVVEAPANGSAVVTEEHETGMVALGCVRQKIKDGIVVRKEVPGVTSLRTDYVWALNRVAAEEDGEVKADDVVVALHGVELDGEATGVAGFVGVFATDRNRREADEDGSLFTYAGEEVGFLGEVRFGRCGMIKTDVP